AGNGGRFVSADLGARHELGVAAEEHVGAAAGHVGRDGERLVATGLRDDLGLAHVVLGVEHRVRNVLLLEHVRENFRLLDGDRADEDRLPLLVALDDLRQDRAELAALVLVDEVGVVVADHRLVRRDLDDVELVDLVELGRFGVGGAGHARQLVVHAEQVLEGDRCQRLVLFLDGDVLFGLDRLVQAVRPATARHLAAGVLVDDEDLALLDEVVDVLLVERVRAQRLRHVVQPLDVFRIVEVDQVELLLDALDALVGEHRRVRLLVEGVVHVLLQGRDDHVDTIVEIGRRLGGTRDDERRARLVDEDRVDLVDDGVVQLALHVALDRVLHIVAQVIEAELVVRAVGDVAAVRQLLLAIRLPVDDGADAHPEELVDAAHPLGVATGEVVVDGDEVDAAPFERVQIERRGGDERLAFAGLHFRDGAAVQDHAADELHVVVAHAEDAAAGLAYRRERLFHDVVERRAVVELLLELGGLAAQLGVAELHPRRLHGVDALDARLEALDLALVRSAENLFDELVDGHQLLARFVTSGKVLLFNCSATT